MRDELPYAMFDRQRSLEEARRFARLESIYHQGQKLMWNGRAFLDQLWEQHGGGGVRPEQRDAFGRVIGTVMWGELAAWKVAAQLADSLEPLEARLAATAQAHDEARHFYVLHDYLERVTGSPPERVSRSARRLIAAALAADSAPKKLIGMQLQVEASALAIFQVLREVNLCPVLSDLLLSFERDEARHVGLGVQLLPVLMASMTRWRRAEVTAYSFKIAAWSVAAVKSMEADLRALGIDPRHLVRLNVSKLKLVFAELWEVSPASRSEAATRAGRLFDAITEAVWPAGGGEVSWSRRLRGALHALDHGYETVATSIEPQTTRRR
jgi:hypothetical protein